MSSLPSGTSFIAPDYRPVATNVEVTTTALKIDLVDGRELMVPFSHWPFLANASDAARCQWEFTFSHDGIYWPILDEYLSIAGLLGLPSD